MIIEGACVQSLFTMRKSNFIWLFAILALINVLIIQCTSFEQEVEIELTEVQNSPNGEHPHDDYKQDGDVPPRPTDFRATITGHKLTVKSGKHNAQVIVYDNTGAQMLNRQFIGKTILRIPSSGSYSLEIRSSSLTLVGRFNTRQ